MVKQPSTVLTTVERDAVNSGSWLPAPQTGYRDCAGETHKLPGGTLFMILKIFAGLDVFLLYLRADLVNLLFF